MIGPPVAGALIDLTGDCRYSGYVALVGGIVWLAAIVPLREVRPRWKVLRQMDESDISQNKEKAGHAWRYS